MRAGTEGLGTVGAEYSVRWSQELGAGKLKLLAPSSRPPLHYRMAEPSAAGRSFDEEALPHLDALYRVALRLTGDPSQAEDLVQDTMLKAYRSWRQYRPGTNAKGWLLTILRNTFINDYRRRKHEPVAMDLELAEPHALDRSIQEVDPEGSFFAQIVDDKVIEAIDALPDEFREVLVLSDVEGMRYAEIAETLQIPVGTVKSRLFRARRQLQADLYAHAVEMGYIQPRESPT
jgi:RNA polymerase sigma-70 factor, ECF subfamily